MPCLATSSWRKVQLILVRLYIALAVGTGLARSLFVGCCTWNVEDQSVRLCHLRPLFPEPYGEPHSVHPGKRRTYGVCDNETLHGSSLLTN